MTYCQGFFFSLIENNSLLIISMPGLSQLCLCSTPNSEGSTLFQLMKLVITHYHQWPQESKTTTLLKLLHTIIICVNTKVT